MTRSKRRFDARAWAEITGAASDQPFESSRGLPLRPVYHLADLERIQAADETPGLPPFTRGAYASMYRQRPWTLRQYAGFATVEESNAFYRRSLAAGQRGLSVAFDLPTHRGYDSDEPRVRGDVGKAGVAIDSIVDLDLLFSGIDLTQTSVSMTMNGAVLPILGGYVALARERGHETSELRGTIQNDILKEFMVRHTYIYPPAASMRIVADIIQFCSSEMGRFNPVSISGYHMQEAGATAVQELAFTLANGLEVVRHAQARGLDVEAFAPRLSFFFGIGMDFFAEVAKLRAARRLWAELMEEKFAAKSAEARRLRMHCQTSGVSLTAQQPLNNVVRTTIEAMAAVLGGTQSLHTNSYDEALALPSDQAARVARNTQLILQHETAITDVVDPLGGSYYVETLTQQMCEAARNLIEQMEEAGGMTAAISRGLPQSHVERSALERQLRIEQGKDLVVGVNLYPEQDETEPELRFVDNRAVVEAQTERLKQLRASRDTTRVEQALARLEQVARATGDENNLLASSVECMAARATVGEVSAVLERVWGRYMPNSATVTGAYGQQYESDPRWQSLQAAVRAFEAAHGRKPRLLVAKLGQDGHDRGAKLIASGFADVGFDVDLAPMFRTPSEVARMAVDHDVHVVGISTQAGAHSELVPELIQALAALDAADVSVVCGGVIPETDRQGLLDAGVVEVFTTGTPVLDCIARVLSVLRVSIPAVGA